MPLKFPRCVAISLKSKVDPQIKKFQTVEALNVNKSINQSEKAVHAAFWHRNRAVFYSTTETATSKNLTPDGMAHAPESGVEFMAPISGTDMGVFVRGFAL